MKTQKIISAKSIGVQDSLDFEVDSPDHNLSLTEWLYQTLTRFVTPSCRQLLFI